jgi:hypothetical protein
MHRDQAAGGAEYDAFDDSFRNVTQSDGTLHLGPERALVHTHQLHTNELRSKQSDEAENGCQQRHRDQTSQEPWRGNVTQRIDRHDLHSGELIRGAHQAYLRCQRGTGTSCKQQRRHHGSQLFQQPQGRCGTQRLLGAESLQQLESLQSQYHADKQPRQHDDDQ